MSVARDMTGGLRPALVLLGCQLLPTLTAGLAQAEAEGGKPSTPRASLEESIRRGVDFLLEDQNADGSWGSARRTKGLNIYAPAPGAHHAFLAADTALCVAALIEVGDSKAEVARALDRAEAWLEVHLPRVRRATPDALYNCWSHAYGIQALVRMLERHASDAARCRKIRELIEGQIELLGRYEAVGGGWGYYDFGAGTQRPDSTVTSFTTATAMVALHEAREAGVTVPERLIRRGQDVLLRQRKPDFSYVYSRSHLFYPMGYVNRPGGSLGRSQACNLASRLWGDKAVTDRVLEAWLQKLLARNLWLDMGRKRPVPHESWFQVAGYFFYYGHYYAALCMEMLPPSRVVEYRQRLASLLCSLQEEDGSWWDYPFYDYHQQYGTAFALMSLVRCRDPHESSTRSETRERTF